ncbi:MAG: sulfatase-like hydrolase/transferase [Verrucomicrobiota bacterium]
MNFSTRLLLLVISPLFLTQSLPAESAPNIVLILADDMGYGDIGAYHSESKIPTPHLDQLAAEGIRFTDAHAGGSSCKPSRYSLLSGTFACRAANLNDRKGPMLPEGRATLASILRDNGYHTAMVGKWHLGFGTRPPRGRRLLAQVLLR